MNYKEFKEETSRLTNNLIALCLTAKTMGFKSVTDDPELSTLFTQDFDEFKRVYNLPEYAEFKTKSEAEKKVASSDTASLSEEK